MLVFVIPYVQFEEFHPYQRANFAEWVQVPFEILYVPQNRSRPICSAEHMRTIMLGLHTAEMLYNPDHYCIIDSDMLFLSPFKPTDHVMYSTVKDT